MPKHFLPENPSLLVNHCLKAYVYENNSLSLLEKEKVVFNNKFDKTKVSLISGGGSGHEPGWIGFVGSGMLTASAQGDIFASPNCNNIKAAESITHSNAGTIFIITNYTGDNLYFGMAAQELISKYGDKKIRLLRVTDDVSIEKSAGKLVGRRTLAGCVYIMKLLGAASEKGWDIDQIFKLGLQANKYIASVNAGLDHVHIPGHAADSNYGQLEANQMELGLGIHNEPGSMKLDLVLSNEELVKRLTGFLLDKNDKERGFLDYNKGDTFVVLFNNLGGVPIIEEKALLYQFLKRLKIKYGIIPSRVYSGHFITSINAPIFTFSIFNVTKAATKEIPEDLLFELLDTPTDATAFPKCYNTPQDILNVDSRIIANFDSGDVTEESGYEYDIPFSADILKKVLKTAANNVIEKEPDITAWDTEMGDGDCGKTLEAGALAILKGIDSGTIQCNTILSVLQAVLHTLKHDMGGTLGAILFIFTNALINKLEMCISEGMSSNSEIFAVSLQYALETLGDFTKARQGHRTVMDVLIPFCNSFAESKSIDTAVEAARKAAEGTRKLRPKLGRATYVGLAPETKDLPPDPGAYGVYEIIAALQLLT